MILKIAKERNFSEEDVQLLIRNPEPIDSLGALSNDQKFDYLIACIQLIFVDHKVFESELIFVKSIAIKLGFKKSVVEYLIDNHDKKPPNDLKSKVLSDYLWFLPLNSISWLKNQFSIAINPAKHDKFAVLF